MNDQSKDDLQRIVFNSPYLVEIFSPRYDMRWENEWRIKNELAFDREDVAFIIAPDAEYPALLEWIDAESEAQGSHVPIYTALPASVFSDPLNFLYMVPKVDHLGWGGGQVPVYGSMKMDFEEFPSPTELEREAIYKNAGPILTSLAKATVQEVYEGRYVARIFRFAESLKDETLNELISVQLAEIAKNSKDPPESVRDLVIAGYTELFKVQYDRIIAR